MLIGIGIKVIIFGIIWILREDQIAEELYISTETVKRHMSTIFEKLGIESRKQLKEVTIKI